MACITYTMQTDFQVAPTKWPARIARKHSQINAPTINHCQNVAPTSSSSPFSTFDPLFLEIEVAREVFSAVQHASESGFAKAYTTKQYRAVKLTPIEIPSSMKALIIVGGRLRASRTFQVIGLFLNSYMSRDWFSQFSEAN